MVFCQCVIALILALGLGCFGFMTFYDVRLSIRILHSRFWSSAPTAAIQHSCNLSKFRLSPCVAAANDDALVRGWGKGAPDAGCFFGQCQ